MKESNLFIATEDEKIKRELLSVLIRGGHKIVATASDMGNALRVVPELPLMSVQVAVLSTLFCKKFSLNGQFTQLTDEIRDSSPGIKIVKISMDKDPIFHGVDIDLNVRHLRDLPNIINRF